MDQLLFTALCAVAILAGLFLLFAGQRYLRAVVTVLMGIIGFLLGNQIIQTQTGHNLLTLGFCIFAAVFFVLFSIFFVRTSAYIISALIIFSLVFGVFFFVAGDSPISELYVFIALAAASLLLAAALVKWARISSAIVLTSLLGAFLTVSAGILVIFTGPSGLRLVLGDFYDAVYFFVLDNQLYTAIAFGVLLVAGIVIQLLFTASDVAPVRHQSKH